MYWWICSAFVYIAALVPARALQRWWNCGEFPIAALSGGHPSRGIAVADHMVQQGLLVWWVAMVRWMIHPTWFQGHPRVVGIDWVLEPVAALLFLASAVVLTAGNLSMGDSWWMGILEEPQPLVTRGAFRFVRHPIYLGMIGYFLAAGALMPTLWMLPSMTLACAGVLQLAALEEDYWLEHEPEAYGALLRETDAFLPLRALSRALSRGLDGSPRS